MKQSAATARVFDDFPLRERPRRHFVGEGALSYASSLYRITSSMVFARCCAGFSAVDEIGG